MSASGIARALWPALRRILIRLGRWVLDDLAEDGVVFVARYLLKRVQVFARRLKRARTKLRRRWLRGRIGRWRHASAWLTANASNLKGKALDAYAELAERIPRTSRLESARAAA